MYSEIAANKRKTTYIMFGFLLAVGLLAWFFSTFVFDTPSATIVVLVIAAAYALFSYFNAGRMATAVNGAVEIEESDNPRLYRIVENLSVTNGMPMPKVYLIDDPGLNAFATGRDPEHAIVAATTGIMNALDDTQLEGVMAHELGHVKNYDIRVSMITFALVTVIAMISDIMLRSVLWGGGNRGGRNNSGPLVLIGLAAAILAPIAATMMQLAISRRREYLADATGALTTRYPEGLAQALEIIGQKGSTLRRQNSSTAHLFFANPLKNGVLKSLFSTHPPIEERVARLRDMESHA